MTQPRYHAEHHDSHPLPQRPQPLTATHADAPRGQHSSAPFQPRRITGPGSTPPIAEPGLQVGDTSTLRFHSSRKLRQLDVEGPSPMVLSINDEPIRTIYPGQNTFEPPIPLNPGDVLRLEVLSPESEAEAAPHFGAQLTKSQTPARTAEGGHHEHTT